MTSLRRTYSLLITTQFSTIDSNSTMQMSLDRLINRQPKGQAMHVMRAFATFSSESDQKSCCILLLLLMASSAMMNRMDSGRFHSLRGASLRPSHANRTAFSPAALPQSLLNKTLLRYRALPGEWPCRTQQDNGSKNSVNYALQAHYMTV